MAEPRPGPAEPPVYPTALGASSLHRITLLGDAAHTMLPHAGQGVNQAIEDSMTLAFFLREAGGPDGIAEAFKRYTSVRMQRTAILQNSSRRSGSQFDSQNEFEDTKKRDAELRAGRDFRRSVVFDYDAVAAAEKALKRSQNTRRALFA